MLKLKKAILLSTLIAPVIGNTLSINTLNESLCSSVVTPTSRGAYIISKPLSYENKGDYYFIQKNKMFSLSKTYSMPEELFSNTESVRDFVVEGDSVWSLSNNSLLRQDKDTGEVLETFSTLPKNFKESRASYAKGIHLLNKKIYIAHGKSGVVVFDLSTRQIEKVVKISSSRGISEAVSITGDSPEKIFVAVSGFQKGFNGIVTLDGQSSRILNKMSYNTKRWGIVTPNATIYQKGNRLFLNNGGWIHSFDSRIVAKSRQLNPYWHVIAEEIERPTNSGRMVTQRKYRRIVGDLIFSKDKIFGCTKFKDYSTGEMRPKTQAKAVFHNLN